LAAGPVDKLTKLRVLLKMVALVVAVLVLLVLPQELALVVKAILGAPKMTQPQVLLLVVVAAVVVQQVLAELREPVLPIQSLGLRLLTLLEVMGKALPVLLTLTWLAAQIPAVAAMGQSMAQAPLLAAQVVREWLLLLTRILTEI
jgi:hypothetical protein